MRTTGGASRSASAGRRRYGRQTPEFARVANLSDAVFAIAMTLLVLTLETPDATSADLGAALVERIPQFVAFALSFALVASIWWAHHRFVALLGALEPGVIAINLVLLGAVALVPFPTSLIGGAPTARAAALPFIGLFIVILVLHLLLLLRARSTGTWREPMPDGLFPWLVAYWALNIGGMSLAFVTAVWLPVAGLAIAAINGSAVGLAMVRLAPYPYREWEP